MASYFRSWLGISFPYCPYYSTGYIQLLEKRSSHKPIQMQWVVSHYGMWSLASTTSFHSFTSWTTKKLKHRWRVANRFLCLVINCSLPTIWIFFEAPKLEQAIIGTKYWNHLMRILPLPRQKNWVKLEIVSLHKYKVRQSL